MFGGAARLFAPIITLLTPITSLVRVIAKPLIELAKKGFKSGIKDIRAGASQIWTTLRGSRESSDSESGTSSEELSDDEGEGDHQQQTNAAEMHIQTKNDSKSPAG